MLFFLVAGHAVMDFALQSDVMAVCKSRHSGHPVQKAVPWYYWMTAHALLHGAAVAVVVHWCGGFDLNVAVAYGLLETVVHWLIDYGKCEKLFGIHIDQGLHLGCKVLWTAMLAQGLTQLPF